jgi:hypothetical protein
MTLDEAARKVREDRNLPQAVEVRNGLASSQEFPAFIEVFLVDGVKDKTTAEVFEIFMLFATTCVQIGIVYGQGQPADPQTSRYLARASRGCRG